MRPALRLLPLLAIALAAPAAGGAYPTVEQTRAEFEAICARLREDSPYFGEKVVAWLERSLAAATQPGERALLHGQLGMEMIRLGRLEAAVGHLEAGLDLIEGLERAADDDLEHRLRLNLGIAHLQIGERDNCIARHSAESCILPIARAAVHEVPLPARAAGDQFERLLADQPTDAVARWLLNIARMVSGDWPERVPPEHRLPEGALESEVEFPAWRNLAPELGVAAFDHAGGAVVEDFDVDGVLDLVSSTWNPCAPMKAFRGDGRGGFEDVTTAWGLDGQFGGLNLVHADYDNDGRPDLLVLRGAWQGEGGRVRNSLLRNDPSDGGRFVDVTAAAGLAYPSYPTQAAAWADFDGDGDLDLYIGNEGSRATTQPTFFVADRETAYPSQLFRNNGDGTFTDVARAAGVQNRRFTKGVAWGDYDDDGDPDLYVSVFEGEAGNRLYRNRGDGTFDDVAPDLGLTGPRGSFPTWFFDYDQDGDLDLFVAAFSISPEAYFATWFGEPSPGGHPVLYANDGGRFTDVSAAMGFLRPALPMGANFGDIDADGFPDLYLGTGLPEFTSIMPNLLYRNRRGGGFDDVTFAGRLGHLQKGHGVAFGDLDNDGDEDLFEQMGGAYPYDAAANALYEQPGEPAAWVTLQLVGRRANRFGVGARIAVAVTAGDAARTHHAVVGSGGSFGGNSLQAEIALGDADRIVSIEVVWPGSGSRQLFEEVALNRFYRAIEGEPALVPVERPRVRLGGEADASQNGGGGG